MSIKNLFLRHRLLIISIFLFLLLVRILLLHFPLLKNLDLEISILFSFVLSLISGFSGLIFLRKRESTLSIFTINIIVSFGLFIIFLLIDVFLYSCPISEGILFFPIFVITSSTFALALSSIINVFSKLKSRLFLVFIYFFMIAYSLLEYYFEPQLFIFNPPIIYFPGLVYNEIFEIDKRILIYSFSLLFSSVLILLPKILEGNHKRIFSLKNYHFYFLAFFIFSFLFLLSDEIGLSTSQNFLEKKFPIKVETQEFKIFIQDQSTPVQERKLFEYKTQFHFNNLQKIFGYKPSFVKIFIFDSDNSKKQLLGDEVADFTKPWLKQIFVTYNSFDRTIKHEMAHIFLGERTENLFKVAAGFNLGLIEGGAMAIEWNWLENTPEYFTAMINKFYPELDLEKFFTNYTFATQKSSLSYLISGSFCKYLIDKYGLEKFLRFYREGNFSLVYNSDLKIELNEFQNILNQNQFNLTDSLKFKVLFGGQTLFERNCPRAINRLKLKAKKYLYQRLFENAEKIFEKIYKRSKSLEDFTNLIRTKFYQREFNEVIKLSNEGEFLNLYDGINSIYLRIYYSLSLASIGEKEKASQIIQQMKSLNLSSKWNAYFDLILFLISKTELIEKMIELNFKEFIDFLKKEFPNETSVLVNDIDNLNNEQLMKVTRAYSKNFWILQNCFYRYLMLGNFVKAKSIIEDIKSNFLNLNEAEKYQLELIDYVFEKFKSEVMN